MNIRDATVTIVSNFPDTFRDKEILMCKTTGITFIRKDLFASALIEFMQEHNITIPPKYGAIQA